MIGLLIFYCCFSMLFSMATVDVNDYETKRGAALAIIFFFIMGPIMFPAILGDLIRRLIRGQLM